MCALPSHGIPAVVPQWTDTPPVVDGRLDDVAWRKAASVGEFQWNGRKAQASTNAYLAYDGEAFYAGFKCEAPAESLDVTYLKDNSPVWQDESVELFIAPWNAPDAGGLYHFAVNSSSARAFLRNEEIQENLDWTAATALTAKGWSAEIRIPLSIFRQKGTNEAAWRILFGRNAKAIGESSSWPECGGRFAYFWSFAELLPPEGRPGFLGRYQPITPRSRPDRQPGIRTLEAAPAEPAIQTTLIPQPKHSKPGTSAFRLTKTTRIVIPKVASGLSVSAARILADWIQEKTGIRPIVQRRSSGSLKGCILIARAGQSEALAPLLKAYGERISAGYPGKEGYVIAVDAQTAVVAGSDDAGVLWGAQTMAQMIRTNSTAAHSASAPEISGGVVRDRPSFPFRSVHLLTAKDTYAFQSKLIRTVLSPLKINYVILQMDKYDWHSHPEITDPANHVSASDVRKLIAYARNYGITYIPLVMSLGHMEWIFRNGHHLDIAEDPSKPYAYCPLNPKSYELIFDLFDEAYELFGRPGLFHIGHDEFDMIGKFPTHEECAKLGKEELYYRDTLKLVAHLKARGARAMMWGDILEKEGFKQQIARLPKDVMIADWHYGPGEDYPSVDFFKEHGYDVIAATWYVPENIYNFSRYAAEHGADGMMQTTWSGWEPASVVLEKWPEQMYQYILGSEWAWSPGARSLDTLPYEAQTEFNRRWGITTVSIDQKQAPASGDLFSVNLGPYANVPLADSTRSPGWLGLGAGNDLSSLSAGPQRLGSFTYRILGSSDGAPAAVMLRGPRITGRLPQQVTGIAVDSHAKQLWFLQTTGYLEGQDRTVGSYTIHYHDGAHEDVPLVYGRNIRSWRDAQPVAQTETAWRGVDALGKAVRLRAFCWTNPHPEKIIRAIDFMAVEDSQASPAVVAITGVK